MQPAQLPNDLLARPKVQVIGVGEDHLHLRLAQLAGIERLHRRLRPNRHEGWRLDWAMGCDENAGAGGAGGRFDREREVPLRHPVQSTPSTVIVPAVGEQEGPGLSVPGRGWPPALAGGSSLSCAARPPNISSMRSSPELCEIIARRTEPSEATATRMCATPVAACLTPSRRGHSGRTMLWPRSRMRSVVMRGWSSEGR